MLNTPLASRQWINESSDAVKAMHDFTHHSISSSKLHKSRLEASVSEWSDWLRTERSIHRKVQNAHARLDRARSTSPFKSHLAERGIDARSEARMRLIEMERQRECTFRPRTGQLTDSDSECPPSSQTASIDKEAAARFHRRQMAWKQQRDERAARAQRAAAEAALLECTFQPRPHPANIGGEGPGAPPPADGLAASLRLYDHGVRFRRHQAALRARLQEEFHRICFRPNAARPPSSSPPRRRYLDPAAAVPRYKSTGLVPTGLRRLNEELKVGRRWTHPPSPELPGRCSCGLHSGSGPGTSRACVEEKSQCNWGAGGDGGMGGNAGGERDTAANRRSLNHCDTARVFRHPPGSP
jgi:hypothetical protein